MALLEIPLIGQESRALPEQHREGHADVDHATDRVRAPAPVQKPVKHPRNDPRSDSSRRDASPRSQANIWLRSLQFPRYPLHCQILSRKHG
jgi:hypothetical protein